MAYQWKNEAQATFRLPVEVNVSGDIATGSDVVTGSRNITFGYVSNAAGLEALVEGADDPPAAEGEIRGLGKIFIEYLFGGSYIISGAKKSVTYSAEEVA